MSNFSLQIRQGVVQLGPKFNTKFGFNATTPTPGRRGAVIGGAGGGEEKQEVLQEEAGTRDPEESNELEKLEENEDLICDWLEESVKF